VSQTEIAKLFKEIPLFSGLTTEEQQPFMDDAIEKSFPKGKIIYIEENPADYFYIIKTGWVKLFRETFDGTEAVIDILTNSHIFGEFSIFDSGVYSSSVQAVEDCVLIALPTSLLQDQIHKNQKLTMNMFAAMSRYQKKQDKEIEHLTVQSTSQRIGCFLLRLCPPDKQNNIVIQLPYDKVLLASRLGMKPESFSRSLNTLRNETGIRINGARVEIDSIEQLAGFSCAGCSSSFPCEDL
jgi:CRP-like cAMP-binding protein